MASVAQYIGLNSAQIVLPTDRVNPDDYPQLVASAKALDEDIRIAYFKAKEATERAEKQLDRAFLERAKEFVELNEQIESSTSLLKDLSTFLSSFQGDLSAVSGHISELQGRSKSIEARLESRKLVEKSLHPYLESITISPQLVHTIVDTDVNDSWISAVTELDSKLGAIRSGPRVENRKSLDQVAEALRLKATQKILLHLTNLLKPFTISVSSSLAELQTAQLLPLKPLFDFLRRHAARQAHDFQKAYVATVRWYYETGFRRYVRALEKSRTLAKANAETSSILNFVPIAEIGAGGDPLSLLAKRGNNSPQANRGKGKEISSPIEFSEINGPNIINFSTTSAANTQPNQFVPEALFRSASLVLADNAQLEFQFLVKFFGQHSSISARPPSVQTPTEEKGVGIGINDADGGMSESGRASLAPSVREEQEEKLKRQIVDGIWKSVMEPAQEYIQNFLAAIIDPNFPPSPVSLLSMIRLNDSIHAISMTACPCLESHLISTRMLLWPLFSKLMNFNIESIRKVNGSFPSAGIFSSATSKNKGIDLKDSGVQIVTIRYAELFKNFIELSAQEDDDENVFSSVLRLRQELEKLLFYQANKIPNPEQQKAFLRNYYQELLTQLSSAKSTHSRMQAEISHYRQLERKLEI